MSAVHPSMLNDTIRPASYPELESEIYLALESPSSRDTLIPAPADAEELIAESKRGGAL